MKTYPLFVSRKHRVFIIGVQLICIASLLTLAPRIASGQRNVQRADAQRLPAPEKIIENYLKAIGGKKRVNAVRDAIYEWRLTLNHQSYGLARTQLKAPASVRADFVFGNGEVSYAATPRSVWFRGLDGRTNTLTGAEATRARLLATLAATRFINYRKLNLLARTVSINSAQLDPSYIVEFTTRDGARVRGEFSQTTRLLSRVTDEAGNTLLRFGDYRAEGDLIEPHLAEVNLSDSVALTLRLESVKRNSNISEAAFEPPRGDGSELDVAALLREVARNQSVIDERVRNYTFTQKQIERTLNERGEVTKENVKVYQVYPIPNRRPVFKLVSENGVALSPERREREERRATNELEEAEREREKDERKREERRARERGNTNGQQEDDADARQFTGILLRACELVSPRRERFRERDAIVFDFRPRAGFRPANRTESLVAKLGGIVWIDPTDKQVMRFEARLTENFKIGGGLLASVRPGTGIVVEQTRLSDGVWLPRFASTLR